MIWEFLALETEIIGHRIFQAGAKKKKEEELVLNLREIMSSVLKHN